MTPADKENSKQSKRLVRMTFLVERVEFFKSGRSRQVGQVGGAPVFVDLMRQRERGEAKSPIACGLNPGQPCKPVPIPLMPRGVNSCRTRNQSPDRKLSWASQALPAFSWKAGFGKLIECRRKI
jgi:hypothetical protein